MSAASFEQLVARLGEEGEQRARVDLLLADIAERMVAASNDQNVQRLSRALRAAAPTIASAVCGGEAASEVPA